MSIDEHATRSRLGSAVALIGLSLAVCACSTTGNKAAAPIEARDASGFSITETARVPARARDDFAQAYQALESGDLARAIVLLEQITQGSPELTAAQINLGIAYQRKGDLALAETALLAALERNPRHPVAHNELGIVYRRMGRFAEARTHFETALSDHPEFHPARKNLGILCDLYLSDPACALEQYELYRSAMPGDEKIEMWIADLRHRNGG